MTVTKRNLTKDERDLLEWLSEEEFSQYGECYGAALNALIEAGLRTSPCPRRAPSVHRQGLHRHQRQDVPSGVADGRRMERGERLMELDVTHMVEARDEMIELSGSAIEHGQNAGHITWNNSVAYGREHPLLTTDEQRNAARAHMREYGAWSDEVINAWSEDVLQAVICQDVAAAIREMEVAVDYEDYKRLCEDGTCSGRVYKGDDGRWYFYLGS